nr:transposase [Candidatus Woesearchaeota archaeon]
SYIEYKAKLKGVPVIKVSEVNTSKTCNVCGITGKRTKNWFVCDCGYEDNADRNAAFNIGKRGLSYMLRSGVNAFAQSSSLNEQVHTLNNVQVCNLH